MHKYFCKLLNIINLEKEHFDQIVNIENNCGLNPYSPSMLVECIAYLKTIACFNDNKIVGFITINLSDKYYPNNLYIVNLNVEINHRGNNIAKMLIYEACKLFDKIANIICLDVNKENKAINLYKKIGFLTTDIPSTNGESDIVMSVEIEKIDKTLKKLLNY